jgi:transcriptional regulator of aroF, aroG, tyrA and aromatic amino acid transport
MARKTLDTGNKSLINQPLTDVPLPDYDLLKCLSGKEITNQKKSVSTLTGRFQYFATQKPIRDFSGNIVGAVEIAKDMQEIKKLARSISDPAQITFGDVIGEHAALQQAISFAQKIAGTDSIISLRGESGTGKELFAKAIHQASNRGGNFVPINCAALPESLLESELFGYAGGAFTGAQKQGKPGLFEQAAGGTIFLDEIGDLPLGPQAKLLRAIQDKLVRRIGGSREIPISARVITATNRNLEQMVEQKEFRQDLYYRINVLPIHIPPLRERRDDIPLLAEHFLFQLTSRLNRPARELTSKALAKLKNHDWPGNVRELKNVIERAAILGESGPVLAENILFSFELAKPNQGLAGSMPQPAVHGSSLKKTLAEYEKAILTKVLKQKTSIRAAAGSLGISHTTLLNKIKKHGL